MTASQVSAKMYRSLVWLLAPIYWLVVVCTTMIVSILTGLVLGLSMTLLTAVYAILLTYSYTARAKNGNLECGISKSGLLKRLAKMKIVAKEIK